ncbi:MAG: bifunctional precorrin-2 dehydrogenase/sirohydrochlorin ferrochelatase [Phycisphaerae bacterium]|jgi:siroheme synthase-like protein
MRTFPIMLDIHGRRVVVVGGGSIGMRRAHSLRQAGAQVVLVAPDAPKGAELDGIAIVRLPYQSDFLEGAFLVFACTNDRAVNSRIARDARGLGAVVNVADQPEDCDFYLPSVASDGDVVMAIGTGGRAPALAAALKDALEPMLPERIGEFADTLSQLRDVLKSRLTDGPRRMELMKRLCGNEVYHEFLERGPKAVEEAMERLLALPAEKIAGEE